MCVYSILYAYTPTQTDILYTAHKYTDIQIEAYNFVPMEEQEKMYSLVLNCGLYGAL